MPERLSNKIYFYSFLLSLLVILVHAENLAPDNLRLQELAAGVPLLSAVSVENFFSNTLGQAAVPGFFLLSGCLFFRSFGSLGELPRKWGKRAYRLLLPYCAWNSLCYLFFVLLGRTAFSGALWLDAVIHYRWNPVFWYLYQLLLLQLSAPLLYLLLRRRTAAFFAFLCLLGLIYSRCSLPYLNADALLYYYAGALLGRYGGRFYEGRDGRLAGGLLLLLPLLLYLRGVPVMSGNAGFSVLLTVLYRLLLPLLLLLLLPMEKLPRAPGWMKNSFFLYALHYPVVRAVSWGIRAFGLTPASPLQSGILLLVYFLLPPLCVFLSAVLTDFLRKRLPLLFSLLSGGR